MEYPSSDFLEEYPAVLRFIADRLTTDPEYALAIFEPAARQILAEKYRVLRKIAAGKHEVLGFARSACFYSGEQESDMVELAKAYAAAGQCQDALEFAKRATAGDPSKAGHLRVVSDLLASLGHYAEAAEALGRAIDLQEEESKEDQVALAHLLSKSEQLPRALSIVDSLLAGDSNNVDLLRFKASLLERHGSYKDAYLAVQKMRKLAPEAAYVASDYKRIRKRYFFSLLCFWRHLRLTKLSSHSTSAPI